VRRLVGALVPKRCQGTHSKALIDLDYSLSRRRDENGNFFRFRAKLTDTHGAQMGRWAWDVVLGKGQ